jgi:hypothetical protein
MRAWRKEAQRLENLANQFKDYLVPIIPMRSEDVSIVSNAFARVNTGGTSMSEAHLAVALAYGRLPLRESLREVEAHFADLGWAVVNQGALLDLLKLRFDLDVYRADIETLLKHFYKTPRGAAAEDLKAVLTETQDYLERAIDLLADVPVLGDGALPYRYQLLLLAEVLRRLHQGRANGVTDELRTRELRTRAERWFWQTSYTEAFTGATGSTFQLALTDLERCLREGVFRLDGASIRRVGRQRWGAVRVMATTLAAAGRGQARGYGRSGPAPRGPRRPGRPQGAARARRGSFRRLDRGPPRAAEVLAPLAQEQWL